MTASPIFYERPGLHTEIYDAMTVGLPQVAGDAAFFAAQAAEVGGPVLELGCGTGRVTWEIAEAGFEVVGLDLSPAMLAVAQGKASGVADDISARTSFVAGDMSDFSLERLFGLVIIPFRAFQVLLTRDDQRRSLQAIRRHLRPGGRLAIDLFDPKLEYCLPGTRDEAQPAADAIHPVTGNRVDVISLYRINDAMTQTFEERWRFVERDAVGDVLREEEELLRMRWTYRFEMQNLLELEGYTVLAEFSDFEGGAPRYGDEQVWIAEA